MASKEENKKARRRELALNKRVRIAHLRSLHEDDISPTEQNELMIHETRRIQKNIQNRDKAIYNKAGLEHIQEKPPHERSSSEIDFFRVQTDRRVKKNERSRLLRLERKEKKLASSTINIEVKNEYEESDTILQVKKHGKWNEWPIVKQKNGGSLQVAKRTKWNEWPDTVTGPVMKTKELQPEAGDLSLLAAAPIADLSSGTIPQQLPNGFFSQLLAMPTCTIECSAIPQVDSLQQYSPAKVFSRLVPTSNGIKSSQCHRNIRSAVDSTQSLTLASSRDKRGRKRNAQDTERSK